MYHFTYPSSLSLDAYARLSACGYVFLWVFVYKCIERNKDRSVCLHHTVVPSLY